MNYIAEINAFERWLETNYLPISSQLLWYKLMCLFNKCGWSEWVTVDNLRLMAAMQMGREATFIKVRDELIKAGLIEYKKGKKGSPNQYHLIPFCTTDLKVKSEVQTVVKSEVYSEVNAVVQTVANTVDINKHKQNKTYKKDTNVSKEPGKVRHKRGEYGHVLLSDDEIYRLSIDYDDQTVQAAIKYLDEYMQMKGKSYKDCNLAIRKWVISAVRERQNKKPQPSSKPNQFHNFNQRDTDYDAMIMQGLMAGQEEYK